MVAELVRETYVRLLAGYTADAALRASVLAEAVLKHVVGSAPGAKAMLGELIGDAARSGKVSREIIDDLNRLNRRRIEAAHYTATASAGNGLDEVQRILDSLVALAMAHGLLDEAAVAEASRSAAVQASEPATTAILRLDRAAQRNSLDDLLAQPRRVLVLLVHGEVGQGHDHFDEVTSWRARAVPKGQWRRIGVAWPAPSQSTGTRLAMLLDAFAAAVGTTLEAPGSDPAVDEAPWQRALEPVLAAVDRVRERLVLQHALGWLAPSDPELVAAYVRLVWSPLAERRGERLVCSLDVRRAERGGIPLSKTWRTSRTEAAIAEGIAHALDELSMPEGGHCAPLAELTSLGADDIAEWLRTERRMPKSAAMTEASGLVSMTRGGRFELVAQRLASLQLDRNRR